MKRIKDLAVFFRDNLSEGKKSIVEYTWSLMEELFNNYSPFISLLDQAITEGLTTIEFTHNKDRDVPTGAAYFEDKNLIKIDATMHPVDLIEAFLFELFNSVNSELKQILEENYENGDNFANASEFAEFKTGFKQRKFILDFLHSNKEKVEQLLIQSGYPEPYIRLIHNIKEGLEFKYISSENLAFLIKHREMYVQGWEEWKNWKDNQDKKLIRNEISKVIEEQDNQKLEKLLSSSPASVEEVHINKAIESGNSKNLELLLNKYKHDIYDSQLIKTIDQPELIKLLLSYLPDILASYKIGGVIGHLSKTGNIAGANFLLNEYKGKIYEDDLPTIRNKKIFEMVKNYPNFVPHISNIENIDPNLIGTLTQDHPDFLT
ncbi:hypothetical protein [Rickettsia endosymbiont of Halotydeus destructor]|uniref:hypothetical protein n=1 Tax=Rickettsia endosymbiont of Halotydeus destructor TaxID=2996754 RepID=UPI003BAE4562